MRATRPTLLTSSGAPSASMMEVETSRRPTLGVVAISHNEEKDLPAFLAHLLPWVDEIVIVDDGSTDRTAELARDGGPRVRFIHSPREPGQYYSHQRNKGIDAASSDWLLHMDIDERVPPALAEEILHAIEDGAMDGYRYRRMDFSLHRPQLGSRKRWNLIHLARREKFRFGGKMHETCLLDAPRERVGQLQGFMWHLKESDYAERVRKNVTYMQVEAETMIERGLRVRWFHLLVHPVYRAMKYYLLNGGWRDGTVGVLDAMYAMTSTFNWYATAWDRSHPIRREEVEAQLRELWRARDDVRQTSPLRRAEAPAQ